MLIVTTSAPLLPNPMLYVRPISAVIYNVGLCPTVECCLCVGTRQALLQGWLLCVGFVCLANVPDLVRWLLETSQFLLNLNVLNDIDKVFQFICSINCSSFINHEVAIIVTSFTSPKSAESYFRFSI